MELQTELETELEIKQKAESKYKYIKMKLSENEYTLIQEITGGSKVSTQIRDMFINLEEFSFKNMPVLNFSLIAEVTKIVNNLEQLDRAVNESRYYSREDEVECVIELLPMIKERARAIVKKNVVSTKGSKDFKSLLSTEEIKEQSQEDRGPRYKEVKIAFTVEQYEKLLERMADYDDMTPAQIMREYFLTMAVRVDKLTPKANPRTIMELNKAGIALNHLARGANKIRKVGGHIDLNHLMELLERVETMIIITYTKEMRDDS
jgi:hypothetical protein